MIERRWAFVLTIVGIFVLLLIMVYSGEDRVSSQEEIDKLEVNSKVILKGLVEGERKFGEGVMLSLSVQDNGELIEVLCENCGYGNVGKRVEILGVVKEIYGEKKVEALRVMIG